MITDGAPRRFGKSVVAVHGGWASSSSSQWRTFSRPPGHTMLSAYLLGAGGLGGSGFSAAAAAARGGGGGGGSGGQTSVLIPWAFLPGVLYLLAGASQSFLSIAPDGAATNVVAWAVNGGAGGNGSGTAVGVAGAAATAAAISSMPIGMAGHTTVVAGVAGAAGGAVAGAIGGPTAIPLNGLRCHGGAGGAGTTSADFAGGSITPIAGSWISDQRSQGAAAGAFDGPGGRPVWTIDASLLFSFAGLGGSSSNAGIGGRGGNAAFGSGGGGGGGGTTGGPGGQGGPGLIILTSW